MLGMTYFETYDRFFRYAFPHLRSAQKEVLNHLRRSLRQSLVVLSAPPGVGKSLIALIDAVASAGVSEGSPGHPGSPVVHIVTISKGLQDQYSKTLEKVVSVNPGWTYTVFKGRQNYPCVLKKGRTAARCPVLNVVLAGRTFCKYKPGRVDDISDAVDHGVFAQLAGGQFLVPPQADEWCPYWHDKFSALRSNFTVFNYHYYLYELFLVGDFPAPDVVVFDEVHRFFDVMDTVFSVDVTSGYLESLGVELPAMSSTNYIATLVSAVKSRFDDVISRLTSFLDAEDVWDAEESKIFGRLLYVYNSLYDLLSRLQLFLRMYTLYFYSFKLYSDGSFRFMARPLPAFMGYILSYLVAQGVRRVLAMSATPGPRVFWDRIVRLATQFSGVPLDFQYYEYGKSPFPVHRRLVFLPTDAPVVTERALRKEVGNYYDLLGGGSVVPRQVVMSSSIVRSQLALIKSLYDIFGRVLVHTWNNKLAELLLYGLEELGIPAVHPVDRPTEEIQEWVASDEKSVLLSATAREGVDLYGDSCRVQVILKYPVPNLRDPYVRAVRRKDPVYYQYQIAANIVQQAGRVVRAQDDWGFTVVYDAVARQNIIRNIHLYPKYFRDALVTRYNTAQTVEAISRLALEFMSS